MRATVSKKRFAMAKTCWQAFRASFAMHPAFGSALEIGFVFSVERRRAFS